MGERRPGIAVDSEGGGVVDPTKNVLDLVAAAVLRNDDLRQAESRRVDELRNAESRRVDEQAVMRAEYEEKLRLAEAKRIDAIRAVDVGAVATASERADRAAGVLADQVRAATQASQSLVDSARASAAQQLEGLREQFSGRIAALEEAQYKSQGRAVVEDPAAAAREAAFTAAMDRLGAKVESLITSRDTSTGKSGGLAQGWQVLVGLAFLALALYGAFRPH